MSTPGNAIVGSRIIYANVNYGPTFGLVYRPINNVKQVLASDLVVGVYTVQPYDQQLIMKVSPAAGVTVQLPDLRLWMNQPYGGLDLLVKDGMNNASTFNLGMAPFGATQTIDGYNAAALPGGVFSIAGDGGSLIFRPLDDMSGWITL